jgi:hypothetical protein
MLIPYAGLRVIGAGRMRSFRGTLTSDPSHHGGPRGECVLASSKPTNVPRHGRRVQNSNGSRIEIWV